jgi:hypothetical protein
LRRFPRDPDIAEKTSIEIAERMPLTSAAHPGSKLRCAVSEGEGEIDWSPHRLYWAPKVIADGFIVAARHRKLPSEKTGQPWSAWPAHRVVVADPG